MSFFDEAVVVRIKKEHLVKVERICDKRKDLFDNRSHFIRCAVIKLIDENKEVLRK